jgi:hypothetical protein
VDNKREQPKAAIGTEEILVTEAHLALERDFRGVLACAGILDVVSGKHDLDFVRRVAWEMTDPEDRKRLRAAAVDLGWNEVVKTIIERTGTVLQTRTVDSRVETEEGVLVTAEDGRRILVQHVTYWPDKAESYLMERR